MQKFEDYQWKWLVGRGSQGFKFSNGECSVLSIEEPDWGTRLGNPVGEPDWGPPYMEEVTDEKC